MDTLLAIILMLVPGGNLKTEGGYLVESTPEDIEGTIAEYGGKDKGFCDLGAGTGTVIDIALKYYGHVKGYEVDPRVYESAVHKEHIELKDFMEVNLSGFDVLYYFLLGSDSEHALMEKLSNEAKNIVLIHHKYSSAAQRENALSLFGSDYQEVNENTVVIRQRNQQNV